MTMWEYKSVILFDYKDPDSVLAKQGEEGWG